MVIAAESLASPGLQSAALAIATESLVLPSLQLAAYPMAVAIAAAWESSATIAPNVASTAIAGDAVEGAGTMSKQVAVLSVHPVIYYIVGWTLYSASKESMIAEDKRPLYFRFATLHTIDEGAANCLEPFDHPRDSTTKKKHAVFR
jgi:hypothetical protein